MSKMLENMRVALAKIQYEHVIFALKLLVLFAMLAYIMFLFVLAMIGVSHTGYHPTITLIQGVWLFLPWALWRYLDIKWYWAFAVFAAYFLVIPLLMMEPFSLKPRTNDELIGDFAAYTMFIVIVGLPVYLVTHFLFLKQLFPNKRDGSAAPTSQSAG